jgi:hypothetical protein
MIYCFTTAFQNAEVRKRKDMNAFHRVWQSQLREC